jgi:hypothetical protein
MLISTLLFHRFQFPIFIFLKSLFAGCTQRRKSCTRAYEPKPKVRQQTPAEKAAGLLPAGPVLYGKGSIFGTAAGLKRH